ncbi:hypothetical protein L9F63_024229, partial [Diploptera punctata]
MCCSTEFVTIKTLTEGKSVCRRSFIKHYNKSNGICTLLLKYVFFSLVLTSFKNTTIATLIQVRTQLRAARRARTMF